MRGNYRFWEPGELAWYKRVALLPVDVAGALYAGAGWLNRKSYDWGLRRRRAIGCSVVSVGGLTAGGSGKTPAAAWVARELKRRGHQVVLASRGHRRRSGDSVQIVSDGRHFRATLDSAGDEPVLLAARSGGVPVIVGPDRVLVGMRAVSAFGADIVVLDDGLQHHRLARDLEILLVDGGQGFGNGRTLPRGPLREPLAALGRADAIGVVDGPVGPEAEAQIARRNPQAQRFEARRVASALRPLAGGPSVPPESLAGRRVGILAGIARPASLRRTLEELGAQVTQVRAFPDHHHYRAKDVRGLATELVWITTEKDALKILPRWVDGVDVRVLAIDLKVAEPHVFLRWLESKLLERARAKSQRR